ncbi:MAG: MFS transporter [Acidimicrobiales bacterium]|nr:MFS transporter [Acidimicrobiales bacterium]
MPPRSPRPAPDDAPPSTPHPDDPIVDPAVHARRWYTLGVLCLSLTIVMIANMSLNLALPSIARDLDASTGSLQWMVDAYALVFAGLLFSAGTLGDRFGRKGALQLGLVLFLVSSALAAVAQTAGMVIAARTVMGVAAAFVMPSTLSIITNVFPAEERGRAIATWAGVAGGAAALGPTGSGLLLEHFWWGSVFLLNVPFALTALVLGRRLVPTSRNPERTPVDVAGALLSIVGVSSLVYAIIEAPHLGWAASETLAAFGVAILALGLFARRELTARHPMLDLRLFLDRRFSVASGGIALTYFTLFGTFFLMAQFLQLVLGLSPLSAGLVQLPVSLIMLTVAPQVPRVVQRYGVRPVVSAGLGFVALGMGTLSQLGAGSSALLVVVAMVPLAVGISATSAPLTTLMMAAVPPRIAGAGSAMNNASRELGGAFGVAVLGSLLTTRFGSALGPAVAHLPAPSRAAAESGLAGALEVARDLPGGAGEQLADAARAAFVDGFGVAGVASAALAVAVAVGASLLLPREGAAPGVAPARGDRADGIVDEIVDVRDAAGAAPAAAALGDG